MMVFDKRTLIETDYLTETLQTEENARKEIFEQMLIQLESIGACRTVYHRLAMVLFNDNLTGDR